MPTPPARRRYLPEDLRALVYAHLDHAHLWRLRGLSRHDPAARRRARQLTFVAGRSGSRHGLLRGPLSTVDDIEDLDAAAPRRATDSQRRRRETAFAFRHVSAARRRLPGRDGPGGLAWLCVRRRGRTAPHGPLLLAADHPGRVEQSAVDSRFYESRARVGARGRVAIVWVPTDGRPATVPTRAQLERCRDAWYDDEADDDADDPWTAF